MSARFQQPQAVFQRFDERDALHPKTRLVGGFGFVRESGRRGSNPRPSAWEADALPTELRPRPKKGTAPSLQQGIAEKRLQADDLTVRTLLDWHPEDGQTMAEYSIILAVITPAIVLTISLLSDRIAGLFSGLPALIP